MGKNGRFGKDYGKVAGKENDSRPGWRGPGFVKKSESKPKTKPPTDGDINSAGEQSVPVEFQQMLLDIYKDSFSAALHSDSLESLLQEVKNALYERDFTRAFGRKDYLEAYAIRWSPSRAICYQSIFITIQKHLAEMLLQCGTSQTELDDESRTSNRNKKPTLHAACFGGAAAEIIGIGGFVRFYQEELARQGVQVDDRLAASVELMTLEQSNKSPKTDLAGQSANEELSSVLECPFQTHILLIDSAQWQDVVRRLQDGITTPPSLSKYASSSRTQANRPLVAATGFETEFLQDDIIEMDEKRISDLVGKRPMLLTLLFTLNELYTTSIGKTTGFLLKLTAVVKPGSLLLVVDSPGSYSETSVGTEAKKYPMHWLLDHTLLETQRSKGPDISPEWVKLLFDDSRWFRIPEKLRYPISLENMRYQIHLYRKT